jgi:hypothetical protein
MLTYDQDHWDSRHPAEEPIQLPMDLTFDIELRTTADDIDQESTGWARTDKIAIDHSDMINVRCGPLCGLKSDISRGPRSARERNRSRGRALRARRRLGLRGAR